MQKQELTKEETDSLKRLEQYKRADYENAKRVYASSGDVMWKWHEIEWRALSKVLKNMGISPLKKKVVL